MPDISELVPHLRGEYKKMNHILDGNLSDKVEHYGHISKLNCPICGAEGIVKDEGCQECGASFEVFLVVENAHAFIQFMPRIDKILNLHQFISLLVCRQIQIPRECPACHEVFSFKPDASGKEKPFCRGVFFPPVLNASGDIQFSYKEHDSPYVENDELRSVSLLEYRRDIEHIASGVLSLDTPEPSHPTETDVREVQQPPITVPKQEPLVEQIEAYLTGKGSSATKQEFIDSTGGSPQGVGKALNKGVNEGRLVKVKHGVYDLPKHQNS